MVTRVPPSLVRAVRDGLVLGAATFVLGAAVDAAVTQFDRQETLRHAPSVPPDLVPFSWSDVLREDWSWTRAVAVWAMVCWCATRARTGRRTRWLPVAVAALVVVARSVVATVAPLSPYSFGELWPGPVSPYRWDEQGGLWVSAAHPAWGFPVLAVAVLVAASLLGARAGRAPDDAASHRVGPLPPPGLAVAAVVVGLPALGATAAACGAYVALTRGPYYSGAEVAHWLVGEVAVPLLLTMVAAALLSGTGPLGSAVTALAVLAIAAPPVTTWFAGGGDLLLAQAAATAVACAVVALWRQCATWGGDVLAPALAPAAAVPPPRLPPDTRPS